MGDAQDSSGGSTRWTVGERTGAIGGGGGSRGADIRHAWELDGVTSVR